MRLMRLPWLGNDFLQGDGVNITTKAQLFLLLLSSSPVFLLKIKAFAKWKLGWLDDFTASEFEAFVELTTTEMFAATRARDSATIAAAASELVGTHWTGIDPTGAWRGQSDVVPCARLTNGSCFGAKLHRVAAGQPLDVEPEMNHLMLQDFTQSEGRRVTKHTTHLVFDRKERVDAKGINQEGHG